MHVIKIIIVTILVIFYFKNETIAQSCLSGDCNNGYGTMLNTHGDTVISKFQNSKVDGELLYASPNHKKYALAPHYYDYYFIKNDTVLEVGKGRVVGDDISPGKNFARILSTPSGNLEVFYGNQQLAFRKGEPIIGFMDKCDDKGSTIQLKSNGKDYTVVRSLNNKNISGVMYIASDKKYAYFNFDNEGKLSFGTAANQVYFYSKIDSILLYKFNGEYKVNFSNLEKCRNIPELTSALNDMPVEQLEFYKPFFRVMAEMKWFINNSLTEKRVYDLNYNLWTEMLQEEIIAVCKLNFPKEYEEYLFRKRLTGLSDNQGTIKYNIHRNADSEISYLDEDSDDAYPFFKAAFKQAFENLLKYASYKVKQDSTKKYYGKNAKEFEFMVRLDN